MSRPSLSLTLMVAIIFSLGGCHGRGSTAGTAATPSDEHTFFVRGRIVGVHGDTVTLDHEAVPGFMAAMTMPYKLRDASIVSELHPGDRITATILVHKNQEGFANPLLDQVVVIAQARPDYKPAVQYHMPKAGDLVPNFVVRNQSNQLVHLDQFRGRLLLVTFIYTRCTVADYCPRMSRNFALVDEQLKQDPTLYAKTHLLSVSFDPTYDTPQVLRSYGGAYTGRFTKETFAHWDFAAPPEAELLSVAEWFGVGIQPGPEGTLNHSVSTALIGADGRVLAWYPKNDWTPAQVLAEIHKAAASV